MLASKWLEAEAAVYGQELAGDEVGGGGEEDGCGGDVVGCAVALHGCFAGELLVGFVDLALHDHSGSDGVDADLGCPGLRHGLREHVQGGLRGAVVGVGGPGMQPAQRADVDDAAGGGAQVRMGSLGHEEGSTGVGGEHRVPLLDGDVFEDFGLEAAGVVDEEVDTAKLFGDGGDGLHDAFGIAEIAADGESVDVEGGEGADGLFGFGLGAEVGDRNVCAAFGQGERDGSADALGGSGYERGLAGQQLVPIHLYLSTWTYP
jgi:hypothetical protein